MWVLVDSSSHLGARQRWNECLGHHSGQLYLRRLADLSRKDPLHDEEHVAVETGTFMPGPHLAHDAVQADGLTIGQGAVDGNYIIQLQVGAGGNGNPELQRRGVVRAQNPAHDIAHSSPSHRADVSQALAIAQALITEGTVVPTGDSGAADAVLACATRDPGRWG